MGLVVAIDGPAGVGKTTTSKRVARLLQLPHIDTGAMYRSIALKALRNAIPFDDDEALATITSNSRIRFLPGTDPVRVFLDDEDVTDQIRTPAISMAASTISAVPAVRRILVRLQQDLGSATGGVLEGRDIGTKVFPDTPFKYFLTARPEVRARRRHAELASQGTSMTFDQVLQEMISRDGQDSTRADSPLRYDETYTVIDTSDLSIPQVVDAIVASIRDQQQSAS